MFTFNQKEILQNFLLSNEQKVTSKEQKVSPHKKYKFIFVYCY